MLSHFSHIQLFAAPWTVAHQTPLSIKFSRQEYWSGLPFSPPGNLTCVSSLLSPASAGRFFTASNTWKAQLWDTYLHFEMEEFESEAGKQLPKTVSELQMWFHAEWVVPGEEVEAWACPSVLGGCWDSPQIRYPASSVSILLQPQFPLLSCVWLLDPGDVEVREQKIRKPSPWRARSAPGHHWCEWWGQQKGCSLALGSISQCVSSASLQTGAFMGRAFLEEIGEKKFLSLERPAVLVYLWLRGS